MGFDLVDFATTTGGATLAGALAGFTAKKFIKILAFLIGLQMGILAYLENNNLITVNWDGIGDGINNIFTTITTLSIPENTSTAEMATAGGSIGGFGVGFVLGFKYG